MLAESFGLAPDPEGRVTERLFGDDDSPVLAESLNMVPDPEGRVTETLDC